MDLSKLPKLSESPPPPPVQPDPAPVRPTYSASSRAEMGIDIWLSLIIGLVLIFLGINFGSYLKCKLTGQPYVTGWTWPNTGPKANQPVEYFDLQGGTAYGEMGYFLMGAALMVDGAVLLLAMMTGQHRKKLILLAMFCAVLGCPCQWVCMRDGLPSRHHAHHLPPDPRHRRRNGDVPIPISRGCVIWDWFAGTVS